MPNFFCTLPFSQPSWNTVGSSHNLALTVLCPGFQKSRVYTYTVREVSKVLAESALLPPHPPTPPPPHPPTPPPPHPPTPPLKKGVRFLAKTSYTQFIFKRAFSARRSMIKKGTSRCQVADCFRERGNVFCLVT